MYSTYLQPWPYTCTVKGDPTTGLATPGLLFLLAVGDGTANKGEEGISAEEDETGLRISMKSS